MQQVHKNVWRHSWITHEIKYFSQRVKQYREHSGHVIMLFHCKPVPLLKLESSALLKWLTNLTALNGSDWPKPCYNLKGSAESRHFRWLWRTGLLELGSLATLASKSTLSWAYPLASHSRNIALFCSCWGIWKVIYGFPQFVNSKAILPPMKHYLNNKVSTCSSLSLFFYLSILRQHFLIDSMWDVYFNA